ncbi:MAG: hypothetical protein M1822_003835 [Bathelium mastoideum]|nr:MAG: hypothetical protein M1822_003835 [Bathelium mastoideum]
MSVKFERETVRTNVPDPRARGPEFRTRDTDFRSRGSDTRPRGPVHELAHDVGAALTRGEGANGYLAAYLKQLQSNPLRTKMLTSGTLAGLQEILASWIANDRNRDGHYFTSRIPKMAIYGAFISAPLGHLLINILQKLFSGRSSVRAKILQIVVSNLIVCFLCSAPKLEIQLIDNCLQVAPIQNTVYLMSMAVIAGAKTFHQIRATVRAGFMPVMKVSWITSPLALAFAQKFLPEQTWVPFFNVVAFVIGTYINAHTKKKRIAALRRKYNNEARSASGRPDDYDQRGY